MTPIVHNPEEEETQATTTLLSLADYKILRQITDEDATRDAQLQLALEIADNAIEEETKRDFLSEPTTLTKKFRYDGSGILDIDDCSNIAWIKIDGAEMVADVDVIAGPRRGPMFWWLEFAFDGPTPNSYSKGQMGFMSNADTFNAAYFVTVEICGTWGWARSDLPASIKQAAAILVDSYATEASNAAGNEGRITSEQIADLGYGYQIEAAPAPGEAPALPAGVIALLEPFKKTEI